MSPLVLAAALVYELSIMPTGGAKTIDGSKAVPFSVEETFPTEADCHAAAKVTLKIHLQMRGLSPSTTANYACTAKEIR